MKIAVCVTIFNEESTIAKLLESLLEQTKKPDEIIVVDGGSRDKTVQIIRHFQKKEGRIRLLVEKCSRAKGRNLAVEMSRGEIIAMTDAGCVADKNWLKNISAPFIHSEVDWAAGFYKMTGETAFQKAASVFLGVLPPKFGVNFLPSTRSIAFRKEIWEKVGGFPENMSGAGEDMAFNFRLVKNAARLALVKSAVVEWGMPTSISNFQFKIFNYAKGDAKSKIWLFPKKGLTSHNIKALSIFARYLVGIGLVIYSLGSPLLALPILAVLAYIFWAFRKTYLEFKDWKVGAWGIALQFVSDFEVMRGFLSGMFGR